MSVYHIAAIITVSVHASTALFQVLLLFLLVCCFVMRSLSLSLCLSPPLSLFVPSDWLLLPTFSSKCVRIVILTVCVV